jgi:uncharacterized protein (TIGR02453 family)
MADARFDGFPVQAFELYEQLADNNTRTWWTAHKSDYQRFVREPMEQLVGELADEFGAANIFRPYRDARFSKDKTPIKDHQGAFVGVEDAIGYYVQLSAAGLMVAGGWYAPQGEQIARYRQSVEGPAGAELERIVVTMRRSWEVDGRQLKTRPRGVDPDHPRLDLLRNRALTVARHYPVEPWLGTRKALSTVRSSWRSMRPIVEWLGDFVGPADDPGRGD